MRLFAQEFPHSRTPRSCRYSHRLPVGFATDRLADGGQDHDLDVIFDLLGGRTMRLRGFIAKAALAATCVAGVVPSIPAGAQPGAIGTTGGPELAFRGCQYYEHIDFGGARRSIGAGVDRNYVGDGWNDQISSIACRGGCSVTVYENRDFGGASVRWSSNISYVGDDWNDQISSLRVRCR